jgi:predicted ATP-grasp superfamily ATP-dependent carboligase
MNPMRQSMQTSTTLRIEKNSVPVVVLVSSQHGGVGLIRSLGREGVRVYGVHQSYWEPAARSRYLQGTFCWDFLAASKEASLSFLVDVARRVGQRPILIATSDITALFVAENVTALGKEYLSASPSAEVVRIFFSKKQTADLCQKMGIPCPRTAQPQSRQDVLEFVQGTQFPVIVKGEFGEFQQRKNHLARIAIVPTAKDLLKICDLNAETRLILQEYIPGGDDSIWMFNGYFNSQSQCLFGATGKKLRQFPPHRGSTCLGVCARNDAVATQTRHLMQAVGYRGPLDTGYRFDARDGQYKLLDVNPRIGSTFRLFAAEKGLDVARALYLDVTGQTIPSADVGEGRKWIVESNDLVSSWNDFRDGQLSPGGWWSSLQGLQEGVWLDSDDLKPLAALPLMWLHKRFSKRTSAALANSPSRDSTTQEA